MAYAKINSVTNANMAKVSNVAKAAIGKIDNIDAPAAGFSNNYSVSFDGVDDYVDLGDSNVFSFGDGSDDSPFSISLWYKLSDVTSEPLITKTGASSTEREWYLAFGSNDKIYFGCYDDSVNKAIYIYSAAFTSTEGSWTHIAVTYDGNEHPDGMEIYVNGSVVGVTRNDRVEYVAMENTAYDVWIGGFQAHSYYATGNIDEVAIFNAELDADAITDIYNSGTPIDLTNDDGNYDNSSDLVGYWRMEENTGTTVADDSSNSNTGTLTNSPTWSADVPG